jgi:hypothetical protein
MKNDRHKYLIYVLSAFLLCKIVSGESHFKNQAILKIHIVKKKDSSNKIYDSGNGFLISSEGQFLTSYQLIRDVINYPKTYKLKVINNNNNELFDIKLAACGNEQNIDLCLLKANYTIKKPFKIAEEEVDEERQVLSTTLLKNNTISTNQGTSFGYQDFKKINHLKSSIPFTKEYLGSPILDKSDMVVAMISYTTGKRAFDSLNLSISSNVMKKFISDKQDFRKLDSEAKKKSNKSMNMSGQKSLKELLKIFKAKNKKIIKSLSQYDKKKQAEEKAESNVLKVKELMKKKDSINAEKENSYKKLITFQGKLQKINDSKNSEKKTILKLEEKIKSLEELNRSNTMKIALNKKKIKGLKPEESKIMIKMNQLMAENIKLGDDQIKSLKQKIRQIIINTKRSDSGEEELKTKINNLNTKIRDQDESIRNIDSKAFDYFNDAI